MKNFLNEIIDAEVFAAIKRYLSLALLISIGWAIRVANSVLKNKKITKRILIATWVIAYGVGIVTDIVMTYYDYDKLRAPIAIGMALISQDVVSYVLSAEGRRKILNRLLSIAGLEKKDKDKDELTK